MNELQQVLLIFAVVVIAGLYFLSRSRQSESNQDADRGAEKNTSTADDQPYIAQQKASDALNELGEAHIPVSEITEQRVSKQSVVEDSKREVKQEDKSVEPEAVANTPAETNIQDDDIHPNQGKLSFGDEFDIPADKQEEKEEQEKPEEQPEPVVEAQQSEPKEGAKHHVLVVDDPGMTGEAEGEQLPKEHIKPSFGIPEEEKQNVEVVSSTDKAPEVFVLLVMSAGQEFQMTHVNQALLGVGLTQSEQDIYVKQDNMGNTIIKVANMLEPGTFPTENFEDYVTPGVAMILELPTTVKAPKAMHELIMMARKVSQRLQGRLYNMERQLIKESDLQSMREAALDYESEPLT